MADERAGAILGDIIDRQRAKSLSKELLNTFDGMSGRVGNAVFMAALGYAVGSWCDRFGPETALYMAADIAGADPAQIKRALEANRKRRMVS